MPLYAIDGVTPTLPDDGSAWIAPSADVIGDARLGAGTSVWFNATIRADNTPVLIGADSNVQEGAVLHSDPGSPLNVGDRVTVGHRAILHGCTVGSDVLIGMGAIVLNDAVIGPHCLVGAGALVTQGKRFEGGQLIMGSPAKAVRPLTAEEIAAIAESAAGYAARARAYAAGLVPVAG